MGPAEAAAATHALGSCTTTRTDIQVNRKVSVDRYTSALFQHVSQKTERKKGRNKERRETSPNQVGVEQPLSRRWKRHGCSVPRREEPPQAARAVGRAGWVHRIPACDGQNRDPVREPHWLAASGEKCGRLERDGSRALWTLALEI